MLDGNGDRITHKLTLCGHTHTTHTHTVWTDYGRGTQQGKRRFLSLADASCLQNILLRAEKCNRGVRGGFKDLAAEHLKVITNGGKNTSPHNHPDVLEIQPVFMVEPSLLSADSKVPLRSPFCVMFIGVNFAHYAQ